MLEEPVLLMFTQMDESLNNAETVEYYNLILSVKVSKRLVEEQIKTPYAFETVP